MSLQLTKSEVIHGRINLKADLKSRYPETFTTFNHNPVCITNVKGLYARVFTPAGVLAGKLFKSTHSVLDIESEAFAFDYARPYIRNGRIAGYYVLGQKDCAYELDIITDALEYGMGTKGFVSLELID